MATEDIGPPPVGGDDAIESDAGTDSEASSAGSSDAGEGLGDFFKPTKRKTRLAKTKAKAKTPAPEACPIPEASASPPCPSSSSSSGRTLEPREDARSLASPHELRAESRAASRAAWKRRGEGMQEIPPSTGTAEMPADLFEERERTAKTPARTPMARQRSATSSSKGARDRSATGLCRPVQQRASDSTRCHWLIDPEKLLSCVEPDTALFLQRQWLALAGIRSAKRSDAADTKGRGRGRKSYPARLNAGWLAQMLKPRGWLAAIPENESRNLPMPEELVSEPDRGQRKPDVGAMREVILHELQLDADSPSSSSGVHDEDTEEQISEQVGSSEDCAPAEESGIFPLDYI